MTKSTFRGLILISGAVAAVLWAGSPDCEVSLCFQSSDTAVAEAANREGVSATAPRTRVSAEDLERIWTEAVPEAAAKVADAPQAGPLEGQRVAESETPEAVFAFQKTETNQDGVLNGGWSEVADAALSEPDDELRGEAIHAVGLSRSGQAVAILLEVAANDPEPGNRSQAIESLWHAAADGLDEDGTIRRALERALSDSEPEIAELAEAALADLVKLEARRG